MLSYCREQTLILQLNTAFRSFSILLPPTTGNEISLQTQPMPTYKIERQSRM